MAAWNAHPPDEPLGNIRVPAAASTSTSWLFKNQEAPLPRRAQRVRRA